MNSTQTRTVTIKIAGEARDLEDADVSWVTQRVNGLRRTGQPVCVEVAVRTDEARLTLTSPDCGSRGPGGRPPNRREQEIFNLWEEMGLQQPGFNGGQVNAFLQRLRHAL